MILGTLVPATTIHPKLIALVRNKQNMYGTWCKAHVIPKKLTVKMGNNGRQHLGFQLVILFKILHREDRDRDSSSGIRAVLPR